MKNSNSQRMAFILDFDGTITTKDTISILARAGLSFQENRGEKFQGIWNEITTKYSEDYSKHIDSYRPAKEERKTLEEEFEYYRSLRETELKSFARVSKSSLFKGLEEQYWKRFGSDAVRSGGVAVRRGFQEFVAGVSKRGFNWGVVSVNFSCDFIQGVLEAGVGAQNANVVVLANHSTREGIVVGPEVDDGSRPVLATSDAKLSSMKRLLHLWRRASDKSREGFSRIIYIGDSGTDIECLTAEGVIGTVMSNDRQSDLVKTLKRIGITVANVENILDGIRHQVYWARNFDEIVGSALFTFAA